MPSASRLATIDFISKFTDSANLGPGFLIDVALLVFWNLLTGTPLLPIPLHSAIQSQPAEAEKAVTHLEEQILEGRKQRIQSRGQAAAREASTARQGQESDIVRRKEDLAEKIGSSEQRELGAKLEETHAVRKPWVPRPISRPSPQEILAAFLPQRSIIILGANQNER